MRKILPLLLLCWLLLCSCSTPAPVEEPADTTTPSEQATGPVPAGFYDPDSTLEAQTNGALQCFPLEGENCSGILTVGENILLFSHTDTGTRLTALEGETLYPSAETDIGLYLTATDASVRYWSGGISFYDTTTKQTVVLDRGLREVSRIPAPEDLCGTPLLSTDRSTLYYCTTDSIRALELESGISRCLKEISMPYQDLSGLWLEDTVLECVISDGSSMQTLFLSTQTGVILDSSEDVLNFCSQENRYYASCSNGAIQSHVFGTAFDQAMVLEPENAGAECCFLPRNNAAVVLCRDEDSLGLEYYDLDSGLHTASLTLEASFFPWSFETDAEGNVLFLNYDEHYGCTTLYRWDISATPSGDTTIHTGIYYTREAPDVEGLAQCQAYAQEIGDRYGIDVLIYKEAALVQPWDYDLGYEHVVSVIWEELELLDQRLAHYPEGFLRTLAGRFEGLKICILRSLTGSAESGSLDSANGIQFWDGYTAYIALAAGDNTEYGLYHELCHLIDTVVLTESSAYDRWEELNPSGFEYDYDYVANQSRNSSAYLQESSRSFIDTYSMSYPKEDRARIMEYAMTAGNESYFQTRTMQAKLKLLCEGIREAFGLQKSPETFLWEQYLQTSLAYTQ